MTIAMLARAAAKAIIRCDDARSELHAAARMAARPDAGFDEYEALIEAAHVFRRAEDQQIHIGLGLVRARRRDYERSVAGRTAENVVPLKPEWGLP